MFGIESESTLVVAMATASPFIVESSTTDPDGMFFGTEAIPGLARGAPWETAEAAPSLITI